MWNDRHDEKQNGITNPGDRYRKNIASLMGIGLSFALAIFVASLMPEALRALMLEQLLFLGAFGACIFAMFARERLFEPKVTGWDQAALLFLGSVVSGYFIDYEAASAALAELAERSREVAS